LLPTLTLQAELDTVGAQKLLAHALDLGLLTLARAAKNDAANPFGATQAPGNGFSSLHSNHQQQYNNDPSNAPQQHFASDSHSQFADSIYTLSQLGRLLLPGDRSVRDVVLFEGETLYERWHGLLERLKPAQVRVVYFDFFLLNCFYFLLFECFT
jgi:hypothetical protein